MHGNFDDKFDRSFAGDVKIPRLTFNEQPLAAIDAKADPVYCLSRAFRHQVPVKFNYLLEYLAWNMDPSPRS